MQTAQNKLTARLESNPNYTLMATVNENEIGALVFHEESSWPSPSSLSSFQRKIQDRQSDLAHQHLVIFDSDLGSNASFEIVIGASKHHPGVDKIASKHLRFNPNGLIAASSGESDEQQQQQNVPNYYHAYGFSSSSLLAFNHEPFDFDTLNIEPEIDPITGVASKILKFHVNKCFLFTLFCST